MGSFKNVFRSATLEASATGTLEILSHVSSSEGITSLLGACINSIRSIV